ncbi:ATP-binding cassette sub-family C member 3 [Alosa alosa]|uniref:ATP-binding cassette sub-family C member 3 n=1 Tax=Alosa alosa TaxID=278164 RepID=UPI002015398C|nr:ATP-binding cassette sub-family C member 3 [Alosa alosa]
MSYCLLTPLTKLAVAYFLKYVLLRSWVNGHENQPREKGVFFLSRITYWWFSRVVAVGQRRPLQLEDLSPVSEEDSAKHVCSTFQQHWKGQEEAAGKDENADGAEAEGLLFAGSVHQGFRLLHALWLTFSPSLLQVGLLRLLTDLLELLAPLALRWIILFIENQAVYDWQGRTYMLALVGIVVCQSLVEQLCEKHSGMTEAKVQVALTGMLYRKLSCVSSHSHHQGAGVAAHLSGDIERVAGLVGTLPLLLSCPLRVALCLGLLWRELGPAALVGLTGLLLLIPLNSAAERRASQLKRSQMTVREDREALLTEMLAEIKMLKQLAWEAWFQDRVTAARERELETLSILGYLTAFLMLSRVCEPFLVCLSSLGAFVLMHDGNVLTAAQVFTSIWLLRLLRPPLFHLPNLSPILTQAKHSLCHLESIFCTETTDLDCCHPGTTSDGAELSLSSSCLTEALYRSSQDDQLSEIKVEMDRASTSGSGADMRGYLRAFGWGWAGLALAAQLGLVLVSVGQDALLGLWTSDAKEVQGLEGWTELRDSRLSLYAVLGLLQAILVCGAAHFLTQGSLRAAGGLHSGLLSDVLHLPLHFFRNTPPQSVLQSFTRDMYVIEHQVPERLHVWAHSQLEMCAVVFLISVITPVFILAAGPLLILLVWVQSQYTFVLRRMKCLEIASHLSVKALFREMPRDENGDAVNSADFSYQDRSDHHQTLHDHLVCHFNKIIMASWVSLRLDAILWVLVFLVTVILMDSADTVDSGIVGLALLYTLRMRGVFHQCRKASADVHDCMLSVRKVAEYSNLEKEAPWVLPCRVPPGWPQRGEIEFRNVETKCPDGHLPALRGLSFHIQRGEKVAVLSRERAGMEALVSCLLRTLEDVSGTLLIDGVDVACLGLQDLRRRINVIPQAPVVFSGSLRANLDPARMLPDAQVWWALDLCHLKETVQVLPGQLLHPMQDGAASLSQGEKRLLCVARALLRGSSVLLVEEPLASVEPEAECLVQQVIHTEFSECTVLTLTQNLHTVMDEHRVLVLDMGRVVDFDTASNVFQRNVALTPRAQTDALKGTQP